MNRKTIAIIFIVLVIIIFGIGIWYFVFNNPAPIIPSPAGTSPFGQGGEALPSTGSGSGKTVLNSTGGGQTAMSELKEISKIQWPVVLPFERGGRTFIRFIDRATGNILETDPETLQQTRVSNTTIPKVYEAICKKTDRCNSTIP